MRAAGALLWDPRDGFRRRGRERGAARVSRWVRPGGWRSGRPARCSSRAHAPGLEPPQHRRLAAACPGSIDGLRQLQARRLKLGIVSNADGTIEEQLRRGEICQVGEGLGVPVLAIIDSGVVGVSKPAAEIFRHALDPIGVAPERALYVGDTVRYDVRGARAAGLVPVHFDPYDLCPEREDHAHIGVLGEVQELI